MAKKRSASSSARKSEADIRVYTKSAAYRRDLEGARRIWDLKIDYLDVPALTNDELERMVRARPARLRALKRPISIRLEPDVLQWLKRGGAGYQTRINELLRKATERSERRARRAS